MNSSAFMDFHCHSTQSDGTYTPLEVVQMAKEAGIGMLALTDHNILSPDPEQLAQEAGGGITLLRGVEMSCTHAFPSGKTVELHVVVLNYREEAPALQEISRHNQSLDREAYINAIADKLRQHGIDVGNYRYLRTKYSAIRRIGRMTIAEEMVRRGFVSSVNEAFDRFIGAHGQALAYVPNPVQFVSLAEVTAAAIQDRGIPILAHLFYYNTLTEPEQEELLALFRELGGPAAAMETEYAKYSRTQRKTLRAFARRFDLGVSAGSDFHGQETSETLRHGFPIQIAHELLKRQQRAYC